jgi:hypothetical protein
MRNFKESIEEALNAIDDARADINAGELDLPVVIDYLSLANGFLKDAEKKYETAIQEWKDESVSNPNKEHYLTAEQLGLK